MEQSPTSDKNSSPRIRDLIEQHKEVRAMMRECVLTLLRSYDPKRTRFHGSFQPDGSSTGPEHGERDTAIVLTAIELAGKSAMDLTPEGRCKDLAAFFKEIIVNPSEKGFRTVCYDDYRKHVFDPCLKKIATAENPDEILLPKRGEGEALAKPFTYRDPFTSAHIVSLLDRCNSGSAYQKLYVKALDCVLSSLTTSYAPHYMFGGASLNGRTPHAFVSHYCLRSLRDTVDTLQNRQAEHRDLAGILNEIQSWFEPEQNSRARLSYDSWKSFRAYVNRKLKPLENAVGLQGAIASLRESALGRDEQPDLERVAAACAAALRKEVDEGAWLTKFEVCVRQEVSGSDGVDEIDSEVRRAMTELQASIDGWQRSASSDDGTRNGLSNDEVGIQEMRMARRFAGLAGLCWKRAFFMGMLQAAKNVRKSFQSLSSPNIKLGRMPDAANPDLADEEGKHAEYANLTIADAIRKAGHAWGKSAELTENYISHLAKWAEAELYRQLSLNTARFKTNFDPPQLAFALHIYSSESRQENADLALKALEVLFESQSKDGMWSAGTPLDLDRTVTSAILISSIEVINVLIPLLKRYKQVDKYSQSLYAIFTWLRTNRHELRIKSINHGESHAANVITGWSSDKAMEDGRIDTWMSAIALQFLAAYSALLQDAINRQSLKGYSMSDPGELKWHDLVDPQLEEEPHKRATAVIREQYIEPFLQKGSSNYTSMILYGPPGTAKTTLAKALAAELGWQFVTITPSDFVRQGVEQSERMARELFENLRQVREVVVLFDEIDEMLRDRSDPEQEKHGIGILRFLIPGMLPKLQELKQYGEKEKLIFIIATNYFDRLDPAIRRRGRIDESFLIPPPDRKSRRCQLEGMMQERNPSCSPERVRYYRRLAQSVAARTGGWVRKDLENILGKFVIGPDWQEKFNDEGTSLSDRQKTVDSVLNIYREKTKYQDFEWTDYVMLRELDSAPGSLRALVPWEFYAGRPNAAEEAKTVMKICWPDEWQKSNQHKPFDDFVEQIINLKPKEKLDLKKTVAGPPKPPNLKS